MNILQKPTPNFRLGRSGYTPKAIVLHLMVGTLRGTDSWFASERSQASSHYGVGYNGGVHQYVQEDDTAWHAGRVSNPTTMLVKDYVGNPNTWTLGIENEGYKPSDLTDMQIRVNAELCVAMAKRWNILLDRQHIIGHYELTSDKPRIDEFVDRVVEQAQKMVKPVEDNTIIELKKQKISLLKKMVELLQTLLRLKK